MISILSGPNFSGRSGWLSQRSKTNAWPHVLRLAPSPEATFTGLAWTLGEELEAAARARKSGAGEASTLDVATLGLDTLAGRALHVLSGGEMVRAGLLSALLQSNGELQIDAALEQLDEHWRAEVVSGLIKSFKGMEHRRLFLIDNRLTEKEEQSADAVVRFPEMPSTMAANIAKLDSVRAAEWIPHVQSAPIEVVGLTFTYPGTSQPIFRNASFTLNPETHHFLMGPNGSGKTTLIKLLSGALIPTTGAIAFGGVRLRPSTKVRHVALAFQNPDHQWTRSTVLDELRQVVGTDQALNIDGYRLLLGTFGIPHDICAAAPIDLPFVAKKRLSNCLSLLSAKPWIVLDEPTLGQDFSYRRSLAALCTAAAEKGRGVIATTHDRAFREMFVKSSTLEPIEGKLVSQALRSPTLC